VIRNTKMIRVTVFLMVSFSCQSIYFYFTPCSLFVLVVELNERHDAEAFFTNTFCVYESLYDSSADLVTDAYIHDAANYRFCYRLPPFSGELTNRIFLFVCIRCGVGDASKTCLIGNSYL